MQPSSHEHELTQGLLMTVHGPQAPPEGARGQVIGGHAKQEATELEGEDPGLQVQRGACAGKEEPRP